MTGAEEEGCNLTGAAWVHGQPGKEGSRAQSEEAEPFCHSHERTGSEGSGWDPMLDEANAKSCSASAGSTKTAL